METTFIYFLKDPTDSNKGYVGKSDAPKERLRCHLKAPEKCYRTNWLKSLTARGIKPLIEILDEVPISEWQFWEREYISLFRALGFKLVNSTDGGDGMTSCKHSPETKEKIRIANLGKKPSSEALAKMSAAQTGRKHSPETLQKMRFAGRNNTSGFIGVHWCKRDKKWVARIRPANRRLINLGRFEDKYDAIFVRRLAEDKYFA